ncbi:MFS transporter [Nocardioides massiliensis]|uniref:MFS family permease n=1 Tax=Nocardioides massiliensis TaxID=1325935 RepID=A0ABT9NME9_9ACTN|nr:MFS transporter [Nocardioides massiliensis]MDP9821599.1 MFS family permease [Nocardioides massiliensis]
MTEAPPLAADPNFRRFWAGVTLGQLGAQLGHIALPVVAVQLLMASELELGVLNAAATAAFLLVGLPAGAWVDRWAKRRVMIRADVVRAVAISAIPVLWAFDALAMWHLYVVAAVIGVATVFFDVAYQSVLPFLVRREQVSDANGKLEGVAQVARVAGPAAGGLLLKVVSAPLLFVADAIGYAFSAFFLSRVHDREVPRVRAPEARLRTEIAEGLGFVLRHRLLVRIVACTTLSNLAFTLAFTLMPILVLRIIGLEPFWFGVVMGAGAVGGIVGAVLAPRIGRVVGEGTAIPLASLLGGATLALVPLSASLGSPYAAMGVLLLAEFCFSFSVLVYNVMQVSMRQRICPEHLLGRMNASIRFFVWGIMPLSALLSGVLGDRIGVVATMWVAVVLACLAAVPVVFSPLLGMKTLPDAPDAAPEPAPSAAATPDPLGSTPPGAEREPGGGAGDAGDR